DFAIMPTGAPIRNGDDAKILEAVFGPNYTSDTKVNLGTVSDARAKRISVMRNEFVKGVKDSNLYTDKPKNGMLGMWMFLVTVIAFIAMLIFSASAPLPGWLVPLTVIIAGLGNISAAITSSP